jgi:DNA-binding transcriptional LysR family regulator
VIVLSDVELRHLDYFVAVAEERSFTRAAARLHVVQSGVSAAIKALERELGTPLLDRTSRRVALTDAGLALLPRARATLDAARDARDAVDQVRGGLRGTLRIGTMTAVGPIDVPVLLGRYHRRYPDVSLSLITLTTGSRGLAEALAEGRFDLAFVSLPGPRPAGVDLRQLAAAPMDLMVPAGHRLAGRPEQVPITELAGETFVDYPAGYGTRVVADRAFARAGLDRHVALEITNTVQAADFVRQGLGIALLPRFAIPRRKDLHRVPVTGADLSWPLALATPAARRPSAAAQALIGMIPPGSL